MTIRLAFDSTTLTADPGARTITALIAPWNSIGSHTNGDRWRFARGSLLYAHAKYLWLNEDHSQGLRFARAVGAEDTPEGLVMTFAVRPGPHGDRMLALAAAGVKAGFSPEIEADGADLGPDPDDPGVTLVKMAHLTGVGMLKNPAFTDTRVIAVMMSATGGNMNCPSCGAPIVDGVAHTCPPAPDAPVTPPVADPVPVTFSADQFGQLLDRLGQAPAVRPVVDPTRTPAPTPPAAVVTEPLPYHFSRVGPASYAFARTEHDLSVDLLAVAKSAAEHTSPGAALDRVNDFIRRSFADVEIADMPGTRVTALRPDMWVPQRDYATPLWDMVGRGPIDEMPFYVPKFTSASGLVSRATEKTEPAGGTMVTETQTITPGQLWGKVEITRQLWRSPGTPALSGILWDQMLRSFYEARESAIATFLNTLTAATDITITAGAADNDAKQARTAQIEAAIAALNFVRGGNRFTGFAVQADLYGMIASTEDDAGRPKYPILNPMNANGTAEAGFTTMNIAGTRAVPSWALAAAGQTAPANSWLFDPSVVMAWAGSPERLFWDFGATVQTANIPQLSFVTLGLYANDAYANVDIAGVRQVIWDPVA